MKYFQSSSYNSGYDYNYNKSTSGLRTERSDQDRERDSCGGDRNRERDSCGGDRHLRFLQDLHRQPEPGRYSVQLH